MRHLRFSWLASSVQLVLLGDEHSNRCCRSCCVRLVFCVVWSGLWHRYGKMLWLWDVLLVSRLFVLMSFPITRSYLFGGNFWRLRLSWSFLLVGPPAHKTAIGRTHQEGFYEAHAKKRHNEYDREGKNAKVSLELNEQGLRALFSLHFCLLLD